MSGTIATGLVSYEAARVAAHYGAPLDLWHTVTLGALAAVLFVLVRLSGALRDIERTPMP